MTTDWDAIIENAITVEFEKLQRGIRNVRRSYRERMAAGRPFTAEERALTRRNMRIHVARIERFTRELDERRARR